MWCRFKFSGILPTFNKDIREKPLYQVWLANKDGEQVMEYIMEKDKLQEFCTLMDDLNYQRLARM